MKLIGVHGTGSKAVFEILGNNPLILHSNVILVPLCQLKLLRPRTPKKSQGVFLIASIK